jgi:hypothetical protein
VEDSRPLAIDLAAVGLAGGPLGAEMFGAQVDESAPRWRSALEAARLAAD